ncbi:MAG: DUF3006 domain-containing protein [Clostridiales bacterium]|nr:DUF3006 domain-containing protein [Clostridiales bacterium]
MKKAIVDRIEDDQVICELEDESFIEMHIELFPKHLKEGDVIIIYKDGIKVDLKATEDRKNSIKELMEDMWE